MEQPLEALTIDAWVALLRSSQRVLENVEQDLKEAGFPQLVWYDVLWELRTHRTRGLRQSEIAEQMLLTKHNLSRLLDRMEKQELVERLLCEEDGRGKRVHIKKGGIALLKKMSPTYTKSIETHFGTRLSPHDKKALLASLQNLTNRNTPNNP